MLKETEEFPQVCVLLRVRSPLTPTGSVCSHHIEIDQTGDQEAGAQ